MIDAVGKESKARDKLKDELEALNGDLAARVEAAESSQAAWDAWQTRWAAAMARIGREPGVLPSEANAVLNLTADLFDRLDKAEEHRRRAEAIARDAGLFASDVWRWPTASPPTWPSASSTLGRRGRPPPSFPTASPAPARAKQSRDALTAQLAEKSWPATPPAPSSPAPAPRWPLSGARPVATPTTPCPPSRSVRPAARGWRRSAPTSTPRC